MIEINFYIYVVLCNTLSIFFKENNFLLDMNIFLQFNKNNFKNCFNKQFYYIFIHTFILF